MESLDYDARPDEAVQMAAIARDALKPWILPTGNLFIADPAKRHRRPAGDPENDVAFVRHDFDDSAWKKVDLPQDWAIAGPFITEGPYACRCLPKST